MKQQIRVKSTRLTEAITRIFAAAGIPHAAGSNVADDLVTAELEGKKSHGVMLVPMYLSRLEAGSISTDTVGTVVRDQDAVVIIDAGNVFGQLTARQAITYASSRALRFGLAAVSVRNAFHFGTAGRYASMLADKGCIGIVMSNTRPLMPPPNGASRATGNNPIAIAIPSDGDYTPRVDMALSTAAMGKIRNAAANGAPIPKDWATDENGVGTIDPNTAINGMLLPASGAKGFGLAFIIDILCGGLSDGAIGEQVNPLFDVLDKPYGCAHVFIAIDPEHFCGLSRFKARSHAAADTITNIAPAPGAARVYAPGERSYRQRNESAGTCLLSKTVCDELIKAGHHYGVPIDEMLSKEE